MSETARGRGKQSGSLTAGTYTSTFYSNQQGYDLSGGNLTIGKANATVTANSNTSLTYNGVNQTVSGFTASGLQGGETENVLAGVAAATTHKNAGTYSTTASGTDGNYNLSFVNGSMVIAKASLTVSAAQVSKTYDGTTSASGSATLGTLAGAGAGESVKTEATLAFTDKNAGTSNKTVRASGLAIKDGAGADVTGNYDISYTDNTSSTIAQKAITLSGITAANKTYDGGTTATVSVGAAVFNDQVAGDVLTVSSTGSFANKTAETGKTVTLTNTLGGTDLANYSITQQTTTSADIAQKAITLSGITAANKTYDGGTTATVSVGAAVFNDQVAGDVLTVSSTGSFADKTAATGKTVTLSNTLGGADLANYSITDQSSTTASIEKASATVKATSNSTTYSGATQTQAAATSSGFITGDNITVSGLASGKNANTYTSNLAVSGADATNYSVTITNLLIAKADAVVTANSNTALTYNGANQTVSGFSASGLQGGETASVLSGVAASTTHKNAGTYSTTASGTDGNYNLSFVNGSMVIGKADLFYTANNSSFSVGTTPSPLSGTVTGFVNNETQSTATSGTLAWTTPATSGSSAGRYAINGSGLLANNYSFSQAAGNSGALTFTLTPTLTLTPPQTTSLVPVITPPPLPSDTSFVNRAQLARNTQPFRDLIDSNTLSPASAETEEEATEKTKENAEENASRPTGSTGMLNTKATGL